MSTLQVANLVSNGTVTSNNLYLPSSNTRIDVKGIHNETTILSTSSVVSANPTPQLDYTFYNANNSFSISGITLTNNPGYITLTSTGNDPIFITPAISINGGQYNIIRIKIRRTAGSAWDGSVFYSTSGHGDSESYKNLMLQPSWDGDWKIIEVNMSELTAGGNDWITNTITQIRFDFGGSASDVFDVEWIRVYESRQIKNIVVAPSITVNNQVITTIPSELVNVQIFTANGTWTKPSWAAAIAAANTSADLVIVHIWGAGGGGNTTFNGGGGGGAFVEGIYLSTMLKNNCEIIIGKGGNAGQQGGFSCFTVANSYNTTDDRTLYAYGGGEAGINLGGGGGGTFGYGTTGNPGEPTTNASYSTTLSYGSPSTFGGGWGGATLSLGGPEAGGASIYGGGGGSINTAAGGASIFGGGGGTSTGSGGTSIYGGIGANSSVAAGYPGGGGAGLTNTTGANGKVVVYTLRKIS